MVILEKKYTLRHFLKINGHEKFDYRSYSPRRSGGL